MQQILIWLLVFRKKFVVSFGIALNRIFLAGRQLENLKLKKRGEKTSESKNVHPLISHHDQTWSRSTVSFCYLALFFPCKFCPLQCSENRSNVGLNCLLTCLIFVIGQSTKISAYEICINKNFKWFAIIKTNSQLSMQNHHKNVFAQVGYMEPVKWSWKDKAC